MQTIDTKPEEQRAFHIAQSLNEQANAVAATDPKARLVHQELAKFHLRAAGIRRDTVPA